MKAVYDLTGAEIIQKEYPVYSASEIKCGALMMLGTTDPDSDADQGLCLVPAYSATAANTAIDAVGVIMETVAAASMTATPAASTNTFYYAPVIINPFMVYEAEFSLDAADDIAITSTSGTTLTVGSLQDDLDGYFVYFANGSTGVKGSLRYLRTSASGSAVMDSALVNDGTSADSIIVIPPALKYSNNLTADSTKLQSSSAAAIASDATNLRVVETLFNTGAAWQPLLKSTGSGLNNLDTVNGDLGPRIVCRIMLKDCAFGVQE